MPGIGLTATSIKVFRGKVRRVLILDSMTPASPSRRRTGVVPHPPDDSLPPPLGQPLPPPSPPPSRARPLCTAAPTGAAADAPSVPPPLGPDPATHPRLALRVRHRFRTVPAWDFDLLAIHRECGAFGPPRPHSGVPKITALRLFHFSQFIGPCCHVGGAQSVRFLQVGT